MAPGAKATLDFMADPIKMGGLAADFTPVVGGVKGAIEEAKAGNPWWSAFNAATVPLDLLTAGTGGAALKGLIGAAGLGGMIAGKGAKTADLELLAQAQKMKAAGAAPDDIYAQTRWWLEHPDQQPRFEISDELAMFNREALPSPDDWGQLPNTSSSEILGHPALYGEYPALQNINVQQILGEGGSYKQGSTYNPMTKELDYPEGTINVGIGLDSLGKKTRGTMLHELQHGLQRREGFARGGSPEMFRETSIKQMVQAEKNIKDMERLRPLLKFMGSRGIDGLDKLDEKTIKLIGTSYGDDALIRLDAATNGDYTNEALTGAIERQKASMDWAGSQQNAMDQYRRLAGEAEARLVQDRMNMNMTERLANPFYQNYDVPLSEQILRMGGGKSMSVAPKGFELATKGQKGLLGRGAIKLKDGRVVIDDSAVHAQQLKKLTDQGIDVNQIESGGFIRGDGSYIEGSADTPRILEQERAKLFVQQKRSAKK